MSSSLASAATVSEFLLEDGCGLIFFTAKAEGDAEEEDEEVGSSRFFALVVESAGALDGATARGGVDLDRGRALSMKRASI